MWRLPASLYMSWSILPPMTELAEKAPTEMKGASYSENAQLGVGFARVPAKGGVPAPLHPSTRATLN